MTDRVRRTAQHALNHCSASTSLECCHRYIWLALLLFAWICRCCNQCLLLQNFVENFSEFSAAQRNAGKHVTIMSELSRLVDTRILMQVSRADCLLDCFHNMKMKQRIQRLKLWAATMSSPNSPASSTCSASWPGTRHCLSWLLHCMIASPKQHS